MTRTIAALFCLLMTLCGGAAPAQQAQGAPHLAMTLAPETARPRAGEAVTLALDTRPQVGWHGYWGENPGDAGFPPKLEWALPAGMTAGAWQWPVPGTLLISGLMNYVYEQPFAPLVTLRVPAGLAVGTRLPVQLKLSYLVCTRSLCVPEAQTVATELTVGDGGAADPRFDGWRRAVPKPLGGDAAFAAQNGRVRIAVPYPAGAPLDGASLLPVTPNAFDYAAAQTVTRDGDRVVIETAGHPAAAFEAVLRVGEGRGLRLTARAGAVPGARGWLGTALAAFGLAVLGGLILNVMPCVFPILSLKALSLARSRESEAHMRGEALAYTAGVVLVCVGLGGAILLLRAWGSAAGWAFQLQDPRMIAALLALCVAIAANLSGLWEVPSLSFEGGANRLGSFATGALAAFVATPCTGPFMAAALGAALVLPWAAGLAVFAGLGLGLALPFLLLGFIPALRRRLPRPGAWMERARRVLAVPMWLTAAGLVWLLWQETGRLGGAVFFALLFGTFFAGLGALQRRGRTMPLAGVAGALAFVVTMSVLWAAGPSVHGGRPGRDLPFSEARLAQLRAQHRPVFAYFTADWCLTCKVNERVAIEPARAALHAKGVAVLVGDWTGGDPALGRFIEAQGRAGVPLYIYYAPGAAMPRVLPQVLTPGVMTGL
ncbi:protein-disulfide reductase DsbD family protein [Sphingomonas sp.]|uniref:protein-disulfide reductase DsbD family protein n=1 Tax=Sphingomonas sp. TaxID=28214 RepID=UPI003CC67E0D